MLNSIIKLINKLAVNAGIRKFARLLKRGLIILDVDTVRLDWEDRDRLAFLCKCGSDIYVVVSNNFDATSAMLARGHRLDAQYGFAGYNVKCSYYLNGEIYRLPLIFVRGLITC